MKTILEPQRELPVIEEADVIVAGGGPAGVAAAICAARQGAKTVLIEQTGDVGGVATTGLMSHWTGNTQGGFYEELLERTSEETGPIEGASFNGDMRQVINPESLKTRLLDLLEEAGVKLYLYTFSCTALTENGRVTGLVTESKAGRRAMLCKILIDATGDGDLAASAGAAYQKGRESDGKMQPMSLMFKVAGVDTERAVFPGGFEDTYDVPRGDLQTLGREHLPFPAGHVLLYRSTLPGVVTCNMTNCIDVDGTDPADLTRAVRECRGQLEPIVEFLRGYVPGFENCWLISTASVIGVRETRHFEGMQTLTEDDIRAARVFDDWAVTKASFNFDIHNIDGSGLDENGEQKKFTQKKGYTIPYGCLVPREVDGLLLAGRNISGTHKAHSNFRVMPICANIGQAAGTAAALCAAQGIQPRELSVPLLQEKLREQGVEP